MKGRSFLALAMLNIPFVLDLTVKKLAQDSLEFGKPMMVFPGFNLTLLFNPGVSFGLFPAASSTGLVFMLMVQAVLCFGIVVYGWTVRTRGIIWPLLLLLSGALANLVDRFMYAAVTDYLDFYIGSYHWPAFNLADIWITLGVAGLIAAEFLAKPTDKPSAVQKG